jgi:hypothetical protein
MVLQSELLRWVIDTFGPRIAYSYKERAARVVEEAIALGQAAGLDLATAGRILARVYSRPPGDITQEIADTAFTLSVLAQVFGLEDCLAREFARVTSAPREQFIKKHAEKVVDGVSE